MKVSEITLNDLRDYLRLDEEEPQLQIFLNSAKSYVKSYTGMTEAEIDTHEEIAPVVFVLVSHYYENRDYVGKEDKVNRVIQSSLDMYCKNLL